MMNSRCIALFALPVVFGAVFTAAAVCPNGWTAQGTSCYVVMTTGTNWYEAKTRCDAVNGYLVEIDDASENAFVSGLLKTSSVTSSWIGLEDFVTEGQFVWLSNQNPTEYTHWAHGEPEHDGSREDCVLMRDTGEWYDDRCAVHEHPSVCEMSASSNEVIG